MYTLTSDKHKYSISITQTEMAGTIYASNRFYQLICNLSTSDEIDIN